MSRARDTSPQRFLSAKRLHPLPQSSKRQKLILTVAAGLLAVWIAFLIVMACLTRG
ncbi:MAG: hypothetical protein GX621_02835 [Pirellulaceae bacterium]|nr:hypothetical protein [Pirellulaceae bacterium]